ncbi:G-protein coupled receptor [Tyrophagus putrescentiae]|nr:G-protein coupled receptor [Tyrophagus putrescentiae]
MQLQVKSAKISLLPHKTRLHQLKNDPSLPIVYTALEAAVAVCAVFGNLLVIVVFLQDRRLRKVTNFYIISLSVADFLVGAIGIPSAILTRIGIPRNSIRLCLTMLSLLVVLCTISILNLVAVSLDRYWAILHPLDYHKRISEKTALVIICICWILGSAIGFLPLFGWNNGHLASDECFFIPIMNYDFLMFLYFVTIVLPAIIMAFFYIRIYIVVVQQLSLNKVRQLSSTDEFILTKVKPNKPKLDGLTYTTHYTRNAKTLLKLSTPAITPQSSFRRFKSSFGKSASSPQQLNEIEQADSSGSSSGSASRHRHNGQSGHAEAAVSSGAVVVIGGGDPLPVHSLTSLSATAHSGRHLSKLGSRNRHALQRSSNLTLDRTERNGKAERKWRSVWSVSSLTEGGYTSGEERPPEKRRTDHSANNSAISSFYRHANAGTGSKLSYSRREAQKLFIIVVFFMICWLPLYTSNTVQAICHHCPTPSNTWLDVLIILSHINSAGSPFLYAFHMKDFRQALRRLICKGAINKHKLRDLRREELLFSISGHRSRTQLHTIPAQTKAAAAAGDHTSEPSTSTESKHVPRTVKQYRTKSSSTKQTRDVRPRFANVPRCCIEVDVDVEETKEDCSMSS